MRRLVISALAAVTVGAAVLGAATSLGVSPGALGAGAAAVTPCDTDGFTTSYTTSGGNVTAVTLGGIADPACEGGKLSLTLTNNNTSIGSGGPQTVPTDGDTTDNSITVPLSPQPAASQVNGIYVVISGP